MHIFKHIHIDKFRAFNSVDIDLNRNLVAIAGQNGTQKTTLLGILAQSVTLTKKPINAARTIDGDVFKVEMGEKFKFSKNHDIIGEHSWNVELDSAIDPRSHFAVRSYPRDDNDTQYFLRFWNACNSRKQGTGFPQCPVIFLSLKRLLPIGEMPNLDDKEMNLDEEEIEIYKKWHNDILILLDDISSIHQLSEKGSKTSIGPQTRVADPITMSAGQDNIGKIILGILSFRRLKKAYPNHYSGGLMFIDEIESTLYPASQLRLLKFLLKMAQGLCLQVFFTTHSLTVLKYLTSDEAKKINETALIYLKRNGATISAIENPNWIGIVSDLTVNLAESKADSKIQVFAEDTVAFDFLDILLPRKLLKLISKQRHCTFGFNEYEKLQRQKIHEFATSIIVLDGDAFRGSNKLHDNVIKKYNNWVALPGNSFPEKDFYEYLWSHKDDSDFWDNPPLGGFSSQYCFRDFTGHTDKQDQIKKWYQTLSKRNRKFLLRKYFVDHSSDREEFNNAFLHAYNSVAKRRGSPEVQL